MIYSWLLFAHILGVIVYVGGKVLVYAVVIPGLFKLDPSLRLLSVARLADRVIKPAAVITLWSGIGLVVNGYSSRFAMAWVVLGALAMAISAWAHGALLDGPLEAVDLRLTEPGDSDAVAASQIRRIAMSGVALGALFAVVIWAMVFKPEA